MNDGKHDDFRPGVTAHSPRRPEIDWRVNIASLATLMISVMVGGIWLGNLSTHVSSQDQRLVEQGLRIRALEQGFQELRDSISRVVTDLAVVRTLVAGNTDVLRRIELFLEKLRDGTEPVPGKGG